MKGKSKILYNAGMNNHQFLKDMRNADKDSIPPKETGIMGQCLLAAAYYGYLVAKFGLDWEKHL